MESTILGLILDSSIIIEAERRGDTVEQLLEYVRKHFGEVDIAISSITVAELVHGVYRTHQPKIAARRRAFIDELKRHVPVHPVTDQTAEIVGRISGEQAAKGINLPFEDLAIGASALEQGYGVATRNLRDFERTPDLTVMRPER